MDLFCNCPVVKAFYEQVIQFTDWFVESSSFRRASNNAAIIFNEIEENAKNVTNFIFLMAKYHVYSCKHTKRELDIHIFQAIVEKVPNIERYNAVKDNKMAQHLRKWHNVSEFSGNDVINDEYISDYLNNI